MQWTCCATVGAGSQFRSDLDDADWAAVRPTEQPAQPELGRCYFDVEARRTAHTEQQHEARQPHLRARACAWADPSVILLHSATALGRHGIRRLARSHDGKRLLHGTHNLLLYGEGGISNNNSRRTTTTRLHVSTPTAHKIAPSQCLTSIPSVVTINPSLSFSCQLEFQAVDQLQRSHQHVLL